MSSPKFVASAERQEGHLHILLIATGSVASVKVPLIVSELRTYANTKIEVVATKSALVFFNPQEIHSSGSRVWTDQDEWRVNYELGDSILHIELRRWADVVLIVPCSANTMAKIAGGICDNLATSILRALSPETPTFVFPAMNTLMYEHPLTRQHIQVITEVIRYHIIGPIEKALACGDVGNGAMTDWRDIVAMVATRFHLRRKDPL